jgi:hypothetical protein
MQRATGLLVGCELPTPNLPRPVHFVPWPGLVPELYRHGHVHLRPCVQVE